jgi:hypothetical protein
VVHIRILTGDVGVGFTQVKERWIIVFGGITIGKIVQGPTGMAALQRIGERLQNLCRQIIETSPIARR